jgi:hypothetical protein
MSLAVQFSKLSLWFGNDANIASQGKLLYFGTFPDAVSAAKCYDTEATRIHGGDAHLNFPPGCSPGPTNTAPHSHSPMLPTVARPGHVRPEPNVSLPVCNAEGPAVPNIGPVVSLLPAFLGISPLRHFPIVSNTINTQIPPSLPATAVLRVLLWGAPQYGAIIETLFGCAMQGCGLQILHA